jgi:hypothetical protein
MRTKVEQGWVGCLLVLTLRDDVEGKDDAGSERCQSKRLTQTISLRLLLQRVRRVISCRFSPVNNSGPDPV